MRNGANFNSQIMQYFSQIQMEWKIQKAEMNDSDIFILELRTAYK